jgi:hypothetical protein
MSKRKPNWTDRENVLLLEEYEKRKVILKTKFSSSITSGDKNRAWQEIANIVNTGNAVKRDIKETQKKWDSICVTAKSEVSLHRRSQRQTCNCYLIH